MASNGQGLVETSFGLGGGYIITTFGYRLLFLPYCCGYARLLVVLL
jgi:hypothetical protein